jgi:hypothetical protein
MYLDEVLHLKIYYGWIEFNLIIKLSKSSSKFVCFTFNVFFLYCCIFVFLYFFVHAFININRQKELFFPDDGQNLTLKYKVNFNKLCINKV